MNPIKVKAAFFTFYYQNMSKPILKKTDLPQSKQVRKVLVIDDDVDILKAIKSGVRLDGSEVEILTAENGFTGLEIAKEQKPDLIILDVLMPQMDGFALLQKLKNDTQLNKIKIIMLTAQDTPKNRWESTYLDVDDFLGKPFDLFELEALIHYHLAGKRKKVI